MTELKTIQSVERQLRYGDKRKIAKRCETSPLSVIRYFNGSHDQLTPELQERIMGSALDLLTERQQKREELSAQAASLEQNHTI